MSKKNEKSERKGREAPKGHRWVETEDESWTFWSEKFDENCHSLSGASAETIYNFIEGCEIEEFATRLSTLNILEVGFGLGIGFEEVWKFWQRKPTCSINFVSFEIDSHLVGQMIGEKWKLREQPIPHYAMSESLQGTSFCGLILLGDARETLKKISEVKDFPQKYHAIFQDPFSPKKNPLLWTREWFDDLRWISHPEVILSTYSASYSVRKALIQAGWSIENRKGFKQKKSSTRGFLQKRRGDPELMDEIQRARINPITDVSLK